VREVFAGGRRVITGDKHIRREEIRRHHTFSKRFGWLADKYGLS
jgi:hypothetical protein